MGNLEADETLIRETPELSVPAEAAPKPDVSVEKEPEYKKSGKHHSKWSAVLISAIFIAAAVTWLFNVSLGVLLTVIGGIVFGITYR